LPDLGVGVGLRVPHQAAVLGGRPPIDWLEVISENFMVEGGRPRRNLDRALAAYPVVPHGVSLSIGGADPLDRQHLRRLRDLVRHTAAPWVSDHLAWSGAGGAHLHELFPLPYTEQALRHVVERCRVVQDALGVRLCLENVSSYVTYRSSSMPEWEFLARLVDEADVGILLDVNNVFVSAVNHGFDALAYLDAIPAERVVQIHVAGHTDLGRYLLDTHSGHVVDPVWELYRHAIARCGSVSTLVEWDEDVPPLEVLLAEAERARQHRDRALAEARARGVPRPTPPRPRAGAAGDAPTPSLEALQLEIVDLVRREAAIDGDPAPAARARAIAADGARLRPEEQLDIYRRQAWIRHRDALAEDLPGLAHVLGVDGFEAFLRAYLRAVPPRGASLRDLPLGAPAFAARYAFPEGRAALARAMLDYEVALVEVFDGPDVVPLDATRLGALPADAWAAARLVVSPLVRRLALDHPVHLLRRAVRAGQAPPLPPAPSPAHVLVFRRDDSVCFEEIEPSAAALLEGLAAGLSLGAACAALCANRGDEEVARLTPALGRWFRRFAELGVFVDVVVDGAAGHDAPEAR
jgi:uncharacterized protein (UPF0276 family)